MVRSRVNHPIVIHPVGGSRRVQNFMSKSLGFFGLLSAGIASLESTTALNINSFGLEEQRHLLKLLNQYQSLVDQCEKLTLASDNKCNHVNAPIKAQTLTQQYAAVFGQYEQSIKIAESLLVNNKNTVQRYQRLFERYQRKLKNTNLSDKQRIRYTKLCHQYEELSRLYS
jgi:hypothetical protein